MKRQDQVTQKRLQISDLQAFLLYLVGQPAERGIRTHDLSD
jgi:hypothetical protein